METKNDDKRVDLQKLYEGMDEKEREALIRVAEKLHKTQVLICKDKSGLADEKPSVLVGN